MIEKSGALSEELAALRGLLRLSQKALARASGVSEGTIRDIESGVTISKPPTLRKLASALANDPLATGPDDARTEAVYQRLMRAAGYSETPPSAPSPDRPSFEAEIATLLAQIPGASIALTSLARGIVYADEDDREFVVEQLRLLAKRYGQAPVAC